MKAPLFTRMPGAALRFDRIPIAVRVGGTYAPEWRTGQNPARTGHTASRPYTAQLTRAENWNNVAFAWSWKKPRILNGITERPLCDSNRGPLFAGRHPSTLEV
ncbi:MAG: hypothetical protein NVS2B15_12790 [Pseudarthrobacter sp.]